ncbi:sucrose synthase [bacterium]|nr:sucrose synthase [bacterium]
MEKAVQLQREYIYQLIQRLVKCEKQFLLRSEIVEAFNVHLQEMKSSRKRQYSNSVYDIVSTAQEAAIEVPWLYLCSRPSIGVWKYYRIHAELLEYEEITAQSFLKFKEHLVDNIHAEYNNWPLEIDFAPFNREFPVLKQTRSIGKGVEFLNKKISSTLFESDKGIEALFNFLRVHKYKGTQLMLSSKIKTLDELQAALRKADKYLSRISANDTWNDVDNDLRTMGFEAGWGRTVKQISNTMALLSDLLEAPDPERLERFLDRIPMIFKIAIITPHGFFGQSNVLGKPDTGGQVVYILDQARALEAEMKNQIYNHGLDIQPKILIITRLIPEAQDTTCDFPMEKVIGCEHTSIVRIPFRDENGAIVPHWISRFEIWPYLERFAHDVEKEIGFIFEGKPDFIIGNYSDGNLVASLLSRSLHVTQCNIAHALEKTKYLYSALYWKDNDSQYHFSCQFTADLIAMNSADFIITSTFQEIAGTDETVGQYESYNTFTMPGLYRVIHGINVFDPKFNIISPGVDEKFFFPYTEKEKRFSIQLKRIEQMVFGDAVGDESYGVLKDRKKPLLFSMARLDYINNITGLVPWFGENPALCEEANLLIIAGYINPDHSSDTEERKQICLMHELIEKYKLFGHIRWLTAKLDKNMTGELYRFVADNRGAFIQPAWFEAFGLTILEAMSSGLPTFATCYGGPLEIIENGISGFHIEPDNGEKSSEIILDFLKKAKKDRSVWDTISAQSIERVQKCYTWKLYSARILRLSRIYAFLKYMTNLERVETQRYLEMFYASVYRSLVDKMRTGQ